MKVSIPSAFSSKVFKYRTIIQLAIAIILLTLTLVRLGTIFQRDIFTDYLAYTDTTQAIMAGSNPYALENMRYRQWTGAPIVYPGYVLFFQGIANDAPKFLSWYLMLSIVTAFGALALLLRKTIFLDKPNSLNTSRGFLIYSILIFTFFNASPVLKTLRLGQSTALIAFCLIAMLFYHRAFFRYVLFGTAAVMKYSLLTIWAPLFFFKKYYKLCFFSFLFFILAGLCPVFFYHDIFALVNAYLYELSRQTSGAGSNTYIISGFDMLHLDFIKNSIIEMSLKSLFIFGGVWLFIREIRQPQVSVNLLFSASCLTMLISYHRLHDLIIVLPFLSLFSYVFFVKKQYGLLAICSFFYIYFLIPESIIFRISSLLGTKLIFLQEWIHLCSYNDNIEQWHNLLPTHAVIMLLLTVFAYYLSVSQANLFYFNLGDIDGDKQSD